MRKELSLIQEHVREKNTMLPGINHRIGSGEFLSRFLIIAVLVVIATLSGIIADAAPKQKGFPTAEVAVKAWIAALKANDNKQLLAIFGDEAKDLIYSGDPVADKERREGFIDDYNKKNSLVREGDKMVIVVGEKDWPFPIPMVKKGDQWVFDTKAGKQEILNRRIGENELSTIQTMLDIFEAQREYAMIDHDGDGVREYAEKVQSDAGKKNGLYWKTKEGEALSPMGEMVASAQAEGYKKSDEKPVPYHGYHFRMLNKQGEHAPGGVADYIVKGQMTGGFAVVAYPAIYGNSGVMTFIVNHDGVVYQKNLGQKSADLAKAMKAYDPDSSWQKVEVKNQ